MVNKKKLLAMLLIFTLTFSYFAVVTEAIAATSFVSLFGGSSNKENENVEFQAYLQNGEETSNDLVSDVNNENLAIQLKLDVKNSGYLRNGKVEIKPQEAEELNFVIKEDNTIAQLANVQSLENNVLEFNKIESSSDALQISIPIQYEMEEYIKETKLKNTAKVIFSGIYVDDKGKENEISQEIELTLAWKDNRTAKIENEVSKYVQFGNDGVILQTIVKVDSSNENQNSLPTKETKLNINVPKINNIAPTQVDVVANSTIGTNGKGVGEVEFSSENCTYNEEEGTIQIKVENTKQFVAANQSDEYLKVEGEEIKQEERYYSKTGTDEYLLTYTFQNVQPSKQEMQVTSNIEAKIVTLSGVEAENKETIVTAEKANTYLLTEQTGNIISYRVENETPEISKMHAYLNKEVEMNTKISINVSSTEFVQEMIVEDIENAYINESENKVSTEDIYYKQISVNQSNFNEILGEDGNLQVLDTAGNILTTINKETAVDENGNYNVNFQDKISKIAIKTSAPINIGNLIITNKKAINNTMAKANYRDIKAITTTTLQKVTLNNVTKELENNTVTTQLKDTTTDFNLKIDTDTLSTATTNNNVEIRLELNNNKLTSDIYGNSIFEIEMPQYITALNITSANLLNGEGLELSNVETYTKDGKIIIKMIVNGKQTILNSGVLTNGTNILLNADIAVDMYAPTMDTVIKAYAYNSEATNYAHPIEYTIENSRTVAYQEASIKYSAPSGMIAVNTLSNYNNQGSQITSFKQGTKTDYIDIYSSAKTVTAEIALINNNENAVSNVTILGRIPFKGVKDFNTNESLGTTIDTTMISGLVSNGNNVGEFTIYYSSNGEATNDLSNANNAWTTNPENLASIKSYLIVPNDSNYQLEAKQNLRFTYQYEIPANLTHNQTIYGTFMVSYTNNLQETIQADLVGLTTGAGPELELNLATNTQTAKENDEIKLTATVKNVGQDIAQNVAVKIPVPTNTSFVSAEANRDNTNVQYANGNIIANIEKMATGSTIEINAVMKVGAINSDATTTTSAIVTAKDLGKELKSNEIKLSFLMNEIRVSQSINNTMSNNFVYNKGTNITVIIMVSNVSEEVKENLTLVTKVPKELKVEKAYEVRGISENQVPYDEATNQITWNIDKIRGNDSKQFNIEISAGDLSQGIIADTVCISTQLSGASIETIKANDININLGKSSISITQTSSTPTYITEGEMINYTFTIRNDGTTRANNVVLKDIIPDGLTVKEMSYESDGNMSTTTMSRTETTELNISIPQNDQVTVNVTALADDLENEKEKTVTNVGTVSNEEIEEIRSNSITHIIQAKEGSNTDNNDNSEDDNNIKNENNNNSEITKSHKISGIAWLDANKNGMRDNDEKRMGGVTAMLVDSTTGVIKATTTTNENGEYSFTGLQNGSYLVLFKYDTAKYTTTTYRKEGIETSTNSDVVTTKIEQNGQKENGAITDVININGANVSNIDIGLIEATKFSLGIDKSITKVTVQNAQGTVTKDFDKVKLAQYGITAKYLAGTTVYVEYTITVTNNGELEGFASQIVDYIPEGMTFNSGLNPDWYTGAEGSLYTKVLANTELTAGQSKEIKLVLTKQMTAENTGLVSNTAEIAEDYNVYGVSDVNSTPANRAQGEDDIATADIILTVKTGETLIYISVIMISLLIAGSVGFGVYRFRTQNKSKGGV